MFHLYSWRRRVSSSKSIQWNKNSYCRCKWHNG
jgi:hypothetical protein